MSRRLKAKTVSRLRVDYPRNINWVCLSCAMCCKDREGGERRIMMLESEADEISSLTSLETDRFSIRSEGSEPYVRVIRKKDGKCFFLENNRCTIYPVRPLTCRFYPFSLSNKGNVAVFKLTDDPCPGLGSGKPLKKMYFSKLLNTARKRLLEIV